MNETQILILGNELDSDGWALIAPYGQHPKSRVARVKGVPTEQRFLQVLDNDSADRLMDKENFMFSKIKRALVGIPVWKGHPDLGDHAPETLGNAAPRLKLGTIDKVRKGERGIEAHFILDNDGVKAVEGGCKFPSALWLVLPNGEIRNGATVCHPFKLLSVGLTDRPNIPGVESLANASGAGVQTDPEPPMKLIAGWLIANGVALANSEQLTETEVLTALTKWKSDQAGQMTALGNEKSTIAGQITALTNEKTTLAGKVTALENEKTTLTTRVTALGNEVKAERTGRATAIVDLAIQKGKIVVAKRGETITTLANSADEAAFTAAADKLLTQARATKTIGGEDGEAKKALGNDMDQKGCRQTYLDAMSKHMTENPSCKPEDAHAAVMNAHPALAEAMRNPPGEKS